MPSVRDNLAVSVKIKNADAIIWRVKTQNAADAIDQIYNQIGFHDD
jgi:hypothetical protein